MSKVISISNHKGAVDIFRYSLKSYGAEDYLSLCRELLKRK